MMYANSYTHVPKFPNHKINVVPAFHHDQVSTRATFVTAHQFFFPSISYALSDTFVVVILPRKKEHLKYSRESNYSTKEEDNYYN